MVELILEILLYLGLAALLGLLLGYLFWGWGTAARISAARADGAAAARTSVDGSAGLREQLQDSEQERMRQAEEIERLLEKLDRSDADTDASGVGAGTELDTPAIDPVPSVTEAGGTGIGEAETTQTVAQFRSSIWKNRGPAPSADEARDAATAETKSEADVEESSDTTQSTIAKAVQTHEDLANEDQSTEENSTQDQSADVQAASVEAENAVGSSAPEAPRGLLAERPSDVDDLKKIKGVGKVMEGVLNDKGIYLFGQLAALDASEVAWVNDAIQAFPGRIHRDRWVEQARDLYQEKYGQPFDQIT